jgi:hypothetical protein
VIIPEHGGKDFAPGHVMLDIAQEATLEIAQESFTATVYRTALIVALEEFFDRVQIFHARQILPKGRPSERGNEPDVRCS